MADGQQPEAVDASADAGDQPTPASDEQAEQADGTVRQELKRGRIAAIQGEDVFVDLPGVDGKSQGVVPLTQFDRSPRIGSIMDFVVVRHDAEEGLTILSREGAVAHTNWEQLRRGSVTRARVIGTNKGGLELEILGGIKAFMPASQVDLHHIGDLEPLVGQKLEAIVQEIDHRAKRLVLSRREYLHQQRETLGRKLWAKIEVGQTIEGTISTVTEYGAFVDLGGAEGLLHISDMAYGHIEKPSELVSVGQKVTVKVLKLDVERRRIGLGLKQAQPDPWEGLADRMKVGDQLTVRVVRIAAFGAFVELEPGLEALLPISEVSWRRVHSPAEVVQEGETIRVAVLQMDMDKRRISVSLKQAMPDPWLGAEHTYAKDSLVEGTVLATTDFGAFVELGNGVEGLVHISELADRRIKKVAEILKVGDVNKFRVLDVDEENRKIRLSLKAVEPTQLKPHTRPRSHDEDHRDSRHSHPVETPLPKLKWDQPLKGGLDL